MGWCVALTGGFILCGDAQYTGGNSNEEPHYDEAYCSFDLVDFPIHQQGIKFSSTQLNESTGATYSTTGAATSSRCSIIDFLRAGEAGAS